MLEFLHTQIVEDGKICFAEHRHFGRTKKDWEAFTAWEYGGRWGKWRLAADKRKEVDGWSARPCRRR